MNLHKDDIYIGKSIYCCAGEDCGTTYEVVSDIYEKDGQEYFNIKNDETGETKSLSVDYLSEFSPY